MKTFVKRVKKHCTGWLPEKAMNQLIIEKNSKSHFFNQEPTTIFCSFTNYN
jgi:hypothetical protein